MLSLQLRRIALRECLDASRNRAWSLFAAVIALLLLVGGLVGYGQARQQGLERQRLQALVAEQWQNQPDRHPHRVAHYGFIAYRSKSPLSFFDFGVENFTGNSIFLEANRQNPANFSEARHSTSMLRFGQLSLAYVLQTLMPLLIFFMAFNAVTKERENGTLALLLCQGVSERTLLFGKVLGACGVLSLIWLPTGILLLGLLALSHPPAELWQRAALLLLAYSAYFVFWVCVAVGVSARSRTSSGSLLVLLSLWAVLFIFLPRCIPNVAERWWPSPSKPEFELALHHEVARQGNGHDPNDPQFAALRKELLEKHGRKHIGDLPINFNGVAMKTGERRSSEVYARHFGNLQQLYQQQNRLTELASWVDPYLGLCCLSTNLCQTDYDHFVDFLRQAEAYRFRMMERLNDLYIHEIVYQGDKEHRVSRDHWKEFPPFHYEPPALMDSLRPLPWLALVCWLLLSLAWVARTRVVR